MATTTACSAPSTVKASGIIKPGENIKVSWSGAKSGTNNAITGYQVYWRITSGGSAPTTKIYTGSTPVTSTATSGSTSISVPSDAKRGYKVVFGVVTKGAGGSSYYSSMKTGGSVSINRYPDTPVYRGNSEIIVPSSFGACEVSVTPGTDKDTQTCSVVYALSSSSSNKTTFNGTLPAPSNQGGSLTYYLWTYDGLEYSQNYISITVTKNIKPVISNVQYNLNLYKALGNGTIYSESISVTSFNCTKNNYTIYYKINDFPKEQAYGALTSFFINVFTDLELRHIDIPQGEEYPWTASFWVNDGIEDSESFPFGEQKMAGLPASNNIQYYNNFDTIEGSNSTIFGDRVCLVFPQDTSVVDYQVIVIYGEEDDWNWCSTQEMENRNGFTILKAIFPSLPPSESSLTFLIMSFNDNTEFANNKYARISGNYINEVKYSARLGTLNMPSEIKPFSGGGLSVVVGEAPFEAASSIENAEATYNLDKICLTFLCNGESKTIERAVNSSNFSYINGLLTFIGGVSVSDIFNINSSSNFNIPHSQYRGTLAATAVVKYKTKSGLYLNCSSPLEINFNLNEPLTSCLINSCMASYSSESVTNSVSSSNKLREGKYCKVRCTIKGKTVDDVQVAASFGADIAKKTFVVQVNKETIAGLSVTSGEWSYQQDIQLPEALEELPSTSGYCVLQANYVSAIYSALTSSSSLDAIKHIQPKVELKSLSATPDYNLTYNMAIQDDGVGGITPKQNSGNITTMSTAEAVNTSALSSGAYIKHAFIKEQNGQYLDTLQVADEYISWTSSSGSVGPAGSQDWQTANLCIKTVSWVKTEGHTTRKESYSPYIIVYHGEPLVSYRSGRIGINTSTPDTEAVLDIRAQDKPIIKMSGSGDSSASLQLNINEGIISYTTAAGDLSQSCVTGQIAGSLAGEELPVVQLATSTRVSNIGSFYLPPGTWDANIYCMFSANSSGRRVMLIGNTSSGNDGHSWDRVSANAVTGNATHLHLRTWLNGGKTFYINGYQNSGSTLEVTPIWGAIRIK